MLSKVNLLLNYEQKNHPKVAFSYNLAEGAGFEPAVGY